MKRSGMLMGKFKLKPDRIPIWVWLELDLNPKRYHLKLLTRLFEAITLHTSTSFECHKDDFQWVLDTLESLFAFFVLFHERHHKM